MIDEVLDFNIISMSYTIQLTKETKDKILGQLEHLTFMVLAGELVKVLRVGHVMFNTATDLGSVVVHVRPVADGEPVPADILAYLAVEQLKTERLLEAIESASKNEPQAADTVQLMPAIQSGEPRRFHCISRKLAATLASIVVHVEEFLPCCSWPLKRSDDAEEIQVLLADGELQEWVKNLGALAPLKQADRENNEHS